MNTENRGDQKDGDSFTVDGKDYKYNYTMSAEDRLLVENVNNGVAAYLDPFGYAIYIDEAAMTYDYAYVLTMNNDKDAYGDWTYYARLVLTDGTMMKVETDNNSDLTGRIVSYSKDKNDVYTLSDRSEYALSAANNLKIENGVASFKADDGHSNFVANSNTVFIVADPETKGGSPTMTTTTSLCTPASPMSPTLTRTPAVLRPSWPPAAATLPAWSSSWMPTCPVPAM